MNNLKKYLITDPKYYSNSLDQFEKKISFVLANKKPDIVCFRDKESLNFIELANSFVQICKKFNINKILINSDYKLAKKLNATGVHLNSSQFDKITIAKDLGLYVIISCHNTKDINKAIKFKADAITYSPIFITPNKGEPKGLENLKKVLDDFKEIDIIALGGIINKQQIDQIAKTKAYGIASIRYFI